MINIIISVVISIFIGIPIGILGSFLAWWIIYHLIVPNIRFSSEICKDKFETDNLGFRYRIKLENYGKRSVTDLELFAKYKVKGLRKERPSNWEIVYIPIHLSKILKVLPARRKMRYIIKFNINEVEDFNQTIYPEKIRKDAKNKSILLEDLLNLGTKSTLQVYGFGFDEFTGVRKFFESKIYKKSDIKFGSFSKKGIEVIPEKEAEEKDLSIEDNDELDNKL